MMDLFSRIFQPPTRQELRRSALVNGTLDARKGPPRFPQWACERFSRPISKALLHELHRTYRAAYRREAREIGPRAPHKLLPEAPTE